MSRWTAFRKSSWTLRATSAALLSGLALVASASQVFATDLPLLEPSAEMVKRFSWVEYSMVAGRAIGVGPVDTNNTVPPKTSPDGRTTERYELKIHESICNLHYELSTSATQLKFVIVNSRQLTVKRNSPDGNYFALFSQMPNQPLAFTLQQGETSQTWQAESFWHLYLAEPEIISIHLIPLLELVHPTWQLAKMGATIEGLLFARAAAHEAPDRNRWMRLIEDLASPKFADRQNAEHELYRAGQAIVPYLQNLDPQRLDAEQAYRIRKLMSTRLAGDEEVDDRADRIALWLAGDEKIWLSLLARDDQKKRELAAEQLGAIIAAPIDFDSAAPRDERQAQIDRLRIKLRSQ